MDYICSKVHTDAASNCDTNFDGTYSEKCVVGGLCNPANANNGGCGSGANGVCTGSVQLPTGKSYHEIQDTATSKEVALKEGTYAICVCLGTAANSGWQTGFYTNGLVSSSSYGPANGDGACNTENEFTLIFSDEVSGRTLKVISEPQLGRFADAGGQLTLRAVAGMSFKYNIKAKSPSAGYQVANGDKIYFAPAALGCGHSTKYSGAGTHVWNYETNAYVSTGVDRRWRTQMLHVCTAIGRRMLAPTATPTLMAITPRRAWWAPHATPPMVITEAVEQAGRLACVALRSLLPILPLPSRRWPSPTMRPERSPPISRRPLARR
jgi:hypothetical protein